MNVLGFLAAVALGSIIGTLIGHWLSWLFNK
jgi:hypothetical protein